MHNQRYYYFICGGSWGSCVTYCQTRFCNNYPPSFKLDILGFRLIKKFKL